MNQRMDDVICRFIGLPAKINAVTVVDNNGDFNVYINANLSCEEQKKAYRHEVRHIRKNHFFIQKPVKDCEIEANNK